MVSVDGRLDSDELESIKTVCVICWGLLGDVLIRVPVIEALKRKLPDARITAVVDPYSMPALDNHPHCEELFVYSRKKKPLYRYLAAAIRNLVNLRRRRFDLSVNLYGGGASPIVAKIINARIRLGFDHTPRLRWSNTISVKKPTFCQHWSRALGTMLLPLGIRPSDIRRGTSYHCRPQDRQQAADLLGSPNARYVAVNLGAGDPKKTWPVEHFVDLLRSLCREFDCTPVVICNPGQEHLSEQFAAQFPAGEIVRLDRLPIPLVAAVLEKCSLIVTGDTGLMHLSFGVKIPVFGLFLHTHPDMVTPEDVVFHACLQQLPNEKDDCGWPRVGANLTAADAYPELARFVRNRLQW